MMPFMRPLLHYGLPSSPRCEVVVPDLICPAGKVPLEEGAAASCLPDNCAGILGFELDENDLSNPEIIRDFATITNWCGCYLVPDYPRCAPKTALQFLVHGGHACSFEGRVMFAAGLPRWRNCAAPVSHVQ